MTQLSTKQLFVQPPTPAPSPLPSIPIQFVKPLTYEFRVAETVVDGKVEKVRLQLQIWEHDEYGTGIVKQTWTDVPRVKFDENGAMLF